MENPICFDCLNSSKGICDNHQKLYEKLYEKCKTSYTATITTTEDAIESLSKTNTKLFNLYKKQSISYMLLLISLPFVFMAGIIMEHIDIVLYISLIMFVLYGSWLINKLK